jgi:hypothetical protein
LALRQKTIPEYRQALQAFRFLCALCVFYAGVIDRIRCLASTMFAATGSRTSATRCLNRRMPVEETLMRDSIFMLAPAGLVVYFLLYPDQFNEFLAWAGRYLH